jgi:amidase
MTVFESREPDEWSVDVAYLSIGDIHDRYAAGDLTPDQLIRFLHRRNIIVGSGNVTLNAVIKFDDSVLEFAGNLPPDTKRPLDGIPFLVKDNIEVAGWRTGAGSNFFTHDAESDAHIIQLLRDAGAIPMASANMSEWASAGSSFLEDGYSTRGGLTGNPWALDRTAGGSSSGSAAGVAAGLAPFALGTETIASITYPASVCGVFAMKPTRGRLSTRGIVPYSRTQDVPGVFARTIADVKAVMSVLLEHDLDAESTPRIRFLTDQDLNDPHQTNSELRDQYEFLCASLAGLGCASGVVARYPADLMDGMIAALTYELNRDLSAYLTDRTSGSLASIAELVYPELVEGDMRFVNDRFEEALFTPVTDIAALRETVDSGFAEILELMLDDATVMLVPAYGPAAKLDMAREARNPTGGYQSCLDGMSSAAGWPTLTIPFTTVHELPVGLLLVARPNCESELMAAAEFLEREALVCGFERPLWKPVRRG